MVYFPLIFLKHGSFRKNIKDVKKTPKTQLRRTPNTTAHGIKNGVDLTGIEIKAHSDHEEGCMSQFIPVIGHAMPVKYV